MEQINSSGAGKTVQIRESINGVGSEIFDRKSPAKAGVVKIVSRLANPVTITLTNKEQLRLGPKGRTESLDSSLVGILPNGVSAIVQS